MMFLRQASPLPPTPAPPALDPFIVGRVTEMVMMTMVLIGVVIVAVKVFGPIARAWARKLEGKVGDPQIHAEIDQMREQLAEVDSLRARVGELEERIEFTERLLAQRKEQDLLPRGGGA
jgi:Tfp pilus assembly protein PilO